VSHSHVRGTRLVTTPLFVAIRIMSHSRTVPGFSLQQLHWAIAGSYFFFDFPAFGAA
jgi:hypothetical protein